MLIPYNDTACIVCVIAGRGTVTPLYLNLKDVVKMHPCHTALPNIVISRRDRVREAEPLAGRGGLGGRAGAPCRLCRTSKLRCSTGSGWVFSARLAQAELKRIWPRAGRSGGRRQARKPSQTARAKPC